jgi:hypothetical protein
VLFAGSHGGGRTWATIATLLQTAKMNDVDPHAWLKRSTDRAGLADLSDRCPHALALQSLNGLCNSLEEADELVRRRYGCSNWPWLPLTLRAHGLGEPAICRSGRAFVEAILSAPRACCGMRASFARRGRTLVCQVNSDYEAIHLTGNVILATWMLRSLQRPI